jgi:hypothetical protein
MHRRLVSGLALLVLALAAPAALLAEEKAAKPGKAAIIVRIAALDDLIADARYLVELAGREEDARQIEGFIKAATGPKGLEGLDTKKPLGLYAWVGPMGIDSQLVVLVPIADEKTFLDLLDRQNIKAEKGEGGLYTANIEKVPFPVYIRFANKYAYVTIRDQDVLDKDRLLAPAAVLPAAGVGTISATINIDQVPENLKNLALGNIELNLAKAKDREMPQETEAQKKFRQAAVDDIGARIKSVLQDGGEFHLHLAVNRKASELSFTLSLAGKSGSTLATEIKDLAQVQSIAAALLSKDAAMNGLLHVSLPAKLRPLLAPVIEEGEKKALDKEEDKGKRQIGAALLKAINPTLKSALLDAGFDLRGPNPSSGLYTAVGGVKVKNGENLDKTFRQLVNELPEKDRKTVTFDVDKADKVSIHKIVPDQLDKDSRRLFGDNPLYLAVRDDALLVSMGQEGLSVLKEVAAAGPKTGKVMEFRMSVARMAPLMEEDNKGATEVARKVFAKDKDGDKIRVTIEGGEALKVRLSMKAQLVAFFSQLDQNKKGQ